MHKQHPLRLLVGLVLLGLATSVLVAWGFAILTPWLKPSNAFLGGRPLIVVREGFQLYWTLDERPGWAALNYQGVLADQMIGQNDERAVPPGTDPGIISIVSNSVLFDRIYADAERVSSALMSQIEVAGHYAQAPEIRLSGWPNYCLFRPLVYTHSDLGLTVSKYDTYLYPTDKFVPTQIIMSGLAINTAFYATLWGLLLVALPATKQRLRKRRGLCAHCGYEVTDLPTCPECGCTLTPA